MIGRIQGVLLEKNPPQILVDCHGVGYEIDVSMGTFYNLPAIGETVTLYTHLAIREDAHILFGFANTQERALFRQLIRISGIGARTALALLSGLSVNDIISAVSTQDTSRLVSIPGIGKKTAERLLLELKGKMGTTVDISNEANAQSNITADIKNALLALGYSERETLIAIKQVPADCTVSDGIRTALKLLSK